MIKNILNFWKGKDFLTKELEDFENMLTDSESMFRIAVDQLTAQTKADLKLRDRLYEIDRGINKYERKIRKRIVAHLSMQPNQDLTTALISMSVVKDAERLGDYSKNIFEVSDLLKQPFTTEYFGKWFRGIDKQILTLFSSTKKCFLESNEEVAQEIMSIERSVRRGCDDGLKALAAADMDSNLAVCAALVYRYFKRVASHLGNIATSVIMPISDLDYYDESRRVT